MRMRPCGRWSGGARLLASALAALTLVVLVTGAVLAQQAGVTEEQSSPVSVDVVWQGADAGPIFSVAMDTHSVDLDGVDLMQTAVLRTAGGLEVQPIEWQAPTGGHHRSGVLTFPPVLDDGSLVPGDGTFELVIRDVGGVPERTFAWPR